MARTFIVGGESWVPMAQWLDGTLVGFPEDRKTEGDVHDFAVGAFVEEIGCLILHADEDMQFCMDLALHVRLTPALPGDSHLCPIVFVTDLPHENFLKQGVYSQIFLTEKVYFSGAHDLSRNLPLYSALLRESYRSDFLDRINIPKPEGNNHSLANQWGASRMYKLVTGKEIGQNEYRDFNNVQKELYYKFIIARISTRAGSPAGSCSEDIPGSALKNILLIDDEADKGWAKTIKKVFIRSRFDAREDVVRERVHDYGELSEESRAKIESGKVDLFLLDLRMGGVSEDVITDPTEFSGYRILKEIKRQNRGNQVIMLTASNKAWNLKAILDPRDGASGYFVKESPEYEFSDDLSASNIRSFKEDARICFDRGYLRDFWTFINGMEPAEGDFFLEDLKSQLMISFEMAAAARDARSFSYAYLSLAQASEVITSYLTDSILLPDGTKELWLRNPYDNGRRTAPCLRQYQKGTIVETDKRPKNRQTLRTSTQHPLFSQKEKMAAIYLQMLGRTDNGMIHLFAQMAQVRNAFIHKDGTRFDESDPITEKKFLTYPAFKDPLLVFSDPGINSMLREAAKAGLLFNNPRAGTFMIRGDIKETSLGFRIYLEVLTRIAKELINTYK